MNKRYVTLPCDRSGLDRSKEREWTKSMTWDHYFSQEDYTQSCLKCGAKNQEEAESKCLGSSDQDHCHGCELWPND